MFHVSVFGLFHDTKQAWYHGSPALVEGNVHIGHLTPKDHLNRSTHHSNLVVIGGGTQYFGQDSGCPTLKLNIVPNLFGMIKLGASVGDRSNPLLCRTRLGSLVQIFNNNELVR